MTNYYEIHENNSGGWLCNPGKGSYIVIKAEDEDAAQGILESQEWYTDDFCECCGERWDNFTEITEFNKYVGFREEDLLQYFNWNFNDIYERQGENNE